jgi:ribosomal protein S6--L-glutamate ligase
VVIKTPCSRQGSGLILAESNLTAQFVIHNLNDVRSGVLIQEFIPPHQRSDIRAFVLGNRVIAALELRPKRGDFRSNIHLRARPKPIRLTRELQRLAVRSTQLLGLEISGTDIIVDSDGRPRVLEVNYSPGFRGLEASWGVDIASQILQYATGSHGVAG